MYVFCLMYIVTCIRKKTGLDVVISMCPFIHACCCGLLSWESNSIFSMPLQSLILCTFQFFSVRNTNTLTIQTLFSIIICFCGGKGSLICNVSSGTLHYVDWWIVTFILRDHNYQSTWCNVPRKLGSLATPLCESGGVGLQKLGVCFLRTLLIWRELG